MSFIKNDDIIKLQTIEREVCTRNMMVKRQLALLNAPITRVTPVSPYPFLQSRLDMRRKVEILKYQNNSTNTKTNNFSKKQQWSMLVNGVTKNESQAKIERNITSVCVLDDNIPTLSSKCDIPGKVITLIYEPTVPLYNYTRYER